MAFFQTDDTGVKVNLRDENGYALHAIGTVAASTLDTASTYQKSCLYVKTDVATGTAALYENVGTLAVPSWNLVGAVSAGEITLAEGRVLLGNDSGVAAALNASTNAQILVGNGTTLASVAVSGDGSLANDGTLTVTGATGDFAGGGKVASSAATSGVGYATGAGGAVTQITSRSTGVTLNTVTGQITTDTTSLAAGASATFTVTDSAVAATDVIVANISSGETTDQTNVRVTGVGAGSFDVTVENNHASTAETGAIVINFAVIKGVAA